MGFSDDDFNDEELREFLADVFSRTGYDFSQYSVSSVKRRIARIIETEGLTSLRQLWSKLLTQKSFETMFVESLSVPTTAMFRDPEVFKFLREQVLPQLVDVPLLRVWSAGCSTGEEAYSLAILLTEAGLYDRSRIYATDINEEFLNKARTGVFPIRLMTDYIVNYLESGGSEEFSSYYTSAYDRVLFTDKLKRNIVFAHHNLAIDTSFNEFTLVFCRNVLIYFNQDLQEKVHKLIEGSLVSGGYLVLGEKESLPRSTARGAYKQLSKPFKVYQRTY
ncbi:protein-glutamate O-methyltransferase CheR [Candidatus Obscuribacterales bacterium]|nr:protein-glutamate O-methyltransferase CheR [Candidatus Obscuribacterales bacterium]MBX3152951.1 protein-glutamate O-methyltransferase CheR [Candidatus Obscuribacterales bacterium]